MPEQDEIRRIKASIKRAKESQSLEEFKKIYVDFIGNRVDSYIELVSHNRKLSSKYLKLAKTLKESGKEVLKCQDYDEAEDIILEYVSKTTEIEREIKEIENKPEGRKESGDSSIMFG